MTLTLTMPEAMARAAADKADAEAITAAVELLKKVLKWDGSVGLPRADEFHDPLRALVLAAKMEEPWALADADGATLGLTHPGFRSRRNAYFMLKLGMTPTAAEEAAIRLISGE